MTILKITQDLDALKTQRAELIKAHEKLIKETDAQIRQLVVARNMLCADLNLELITTAEAVIKVSGPVSTDRRAGVVRDAISDIAKGCPHMKKQFFGVKIYSGFGEQLCDCEYGMGPRHGSIVFSVGLRQPYGQETLTPEQAEACIYYLLNIERVQKAQQEAKCTA